MNDIAVSTQMPRYVSHKKVWALKIEAINYDAAVGSATITPAESGYAPFRVGAAYVEKHKPQVGGYYVVYDDGYRSFSPAEAFESGYTRI